MTKFRGQGLSRAFSPNLPGEDIKETASRSAECEDKDTVVILSKEVRREKRIERMPCFYSEMNKERQQRSLEDATSFQSWSYIPR